MCGESSESTSEAVAKSQARLEAAWGAETDKASVECPLKGSEEAPPHSGKCSKCSKGDTHVAHSLPRNDEALEEATKLQKEMDSIEHIGDSKAKLSLLSPEKSGQMFGVLVCINSKGERVVLKAFSGAFDATDVQEVEGWCPPVGDFQTEKELGKAVEKARREANEAADAMKARQEAELRQAEVRFKATDNAYEGDLKRIGQLRLTPEEWQKLGYGEGRPEIPTDSKAKKESKPYLDVASKMYTPLNEERSKNKEQHKQTKKELVDKHKKEVENLEEVKALETAIEALEKHKATSRMMRNFTEGEAAPLSDVCCPPSELSGSGRLGACAAPKLLAQARENDLIPVSIAEFWYGGNTTTKKHEQFYQSCEYCRSILGFALCGLVEAQKALYSRLGKTQ